MAKSHDMVTVSTSTTNSIMSFMVERGEEFWLVEVCSFEPRLATSTWAFLDCRFVRCDAL